MLPPGAPVTRHRARPAFRAAQPILLAFWHRGAARAGQPGRPSTWPHASAGPRMNYCDHPGTHLPTCFTMVRCQLLRAAEPCNGQCLPRRCGPSWPPRVGCAAFAPGAAPPYGRCARLLRVWCDATTPESPSALASRRAASAPQKGSAELRAARRACAPCTVPRTCSGAWLLRNRSCPGPPRIGGPIDPRLGLRNRCAPRVLRAPDRAHVTSAGGRARTPRPVF